MKMKNFLFAAIILSQFSVEARSANLNLEAVFTEIRNIDFQFNFVHQNQTHKFQSFILNSSKYEFQNSWNFGGELIDHRAWNRSHNSFLYDFPFRFQSPFKIVIGDGLIVNRWEIRKNFQCGKTDLAYFFVLTGSGNESHPRFSQTFYDLVTETYYCDMMVFLLDFKTNIEMEPPIGNLVDRRSPVFYICQICAAKSHFIGNKTVQERNKLIASHSLFQQQILLSVQKLHSIRKAYLSQFHGTEVTIHGDPECNSSLRIRKPFCEFLELSSGRLNYTRKPQTFFGPVYRIFLEELPAHATTKLTPSILSFTAMFITGHRKYFVVYCENELKLESASFSHWLRPFDFKVWILILLSFLGTALTSKHKFLDALLKLVQIAYRQSIGRWLSRNNIFMTMSFLVITGWYEAFITSYLIKPLPPKVFQTVMELLGAKENYKFLLETVEFIQGTKYPIKRDYLRNGVEEAYAYHEIIDGLVRRNVSEKKRANLGVSLHDRKNQTGCGWNRLECFRKPETNLALVFQLEEADSSLLELQNGIGNKKYCHKVPEILSTLGVGWGIYGNGRLELSEFMGIMQDFGFMRKWESGYNWWVNYNRSVHLSDVGSRDGNLNHVLNKGTKWSELKLEGNILHIFYIHLALLLLDIVILCFEYLCHYCLQK